MPVNEYVCLECQKGFERVTFKGDEGKVPCPHCQSAHTKKKAGAESFMGKSIGSLAITPPKGPS